MVTKQEIKTMLDLVQKGCRVRTMDVDEVEFHVGRIKRILTNIFPKKFLHNISIVYAPYQIFASSYNGKPEQTVIEVMFNRRGDEIISIERIDARKRTKVLISHNDCEAVNYLEKYIAESLQV